MAKTAAEASAAPSVAPPRQVSSRESLATRTFASVIAVCAFAVLVANWKSLLLFAYSEWRGLLLWAAILLVVNLFPVRVAEMTLTLDLPILLAIVILYPAAPAAALALLSGVDVREFSGEINLTRALFNRGQIALSVFMAGTAFHLVSPGIAAWPVGLGGLLAALATFHVVNVLLVSCFTSLRTGRRVGVILRQMIVGDWREFLPSYFGFGALAAILAFLWTNLGAWSVMLFLAPLLVARQALVREQRVQKLTQQLKERERLVQKLFDRMADERKDERTRIACDLHDDVLSSLIRISQLGGFIRQDARQRAGIEHDLLELTSLSEEAAEKVRTVLRGLELSGIGRGGLGASVSGLVRELQLRWRIPIEIELSISVAVPPSVELCAYQIIKEALENAVRYSHASKIRVWISGNERELQAMISDDGVGFRPEEVDRDSHFGLRLLEARAHLAGGSLELKTSPGLGTTLRATLPLQRKRPEELLMNPSGLL